MPDTRDPKRSAPRDFDDLVDEPRQAANADRSDDPLAELARLIDEDPFADFNSRRREPMPSQEIDRRPDPAFTEPPAEAEQDHQNAPDIDPGASYGQPETYQEPAAYQDPAEPELPSIDDLEGASDYDQESTERLYADLAAASQRVEPSLGRDYRQPDPAPEPTASAWQDQDYDAAAALGESLGVERTQPDQVEADAYDTVPAGYARQDEAPDLRAANYDDDVYAESEPVFDDSGHVPPYDGEDPTGPTGRRKGTLIVAGLLGLVVLGGASALVYRGIFGEGTDGPPPLIRADKGPAKLEPKNDGTDDAPQQGKLVYDRVGGKKSNDNTRLVSREEPVADVDGRQVRVIDPNTEQQGTELRGTAATDDPAGSEELPKRVRTVVVKPDGTIVGEIEAPKPALPLQPAPLPGSEPAVTETATSETAPAATDTASTGTGNGIPIPEPKPVELASAQQAATQQAPAAAPTVTTQPAPAPVTTSPAPAPAATKPVENFVPPAAPTQQKAGQPLQLNPDVAATLPSTTQSAPAAAPAQPVPTQTATAPAQPEAAPTATFPAGSYVVQVAASRSEQDARGTASSIGQRYGNVLSGYAPAVERADLGDRGIYYRVGVGPMTSQSDANSVCSKLKSAGLDCFVRRN